MTSEKPIRGQMTAEGMRLLAEGKMPVGDNDPRYSHVTVTDTNGTPITQASINSRYPAAAAASARRQKIQGKVIKEYWCNCRLKEVHL